LPYQPDPVSVPWERAASSLLRRAYDARGKWVATRLRDPTDAELARFAAIGINVAGRDNAATLSGEHENYRTRWARGFARALFRVNQSNGNRPLELEVGARKPALGVLPAGRAIRLRTRRGGSVARRAVARKADSARIFDDEGFAAGRWADPEGRDWGQ
jgi:hypothetical protein